MTKFWDKCEVNMVPEISDGDIEAMLKVMKPVANVKPIGHGRFREIDVGDVDRRGTSYIFSPKLGRPVQIYLGGLNDRTILTFHTLAYYGMFKPTLAESLACIRRHVPAWFLVRYFWLDSANMDHKNIVGNFYWCRCVLFGEEEANVQDERWKDFMDSCKEQVR